MLFSHYRLLKKKSGNLSPPVLYLEVQLFNLCDDIKYSKPIDISPFQSKCFMTWVNYAFTNETRKKVNSQVNKIFLAKILFWNMLKLGKMIAII